MGNMMGTLRLHKYWIPPGRRRGRQNHALAALQASDMKLHHERVMRYVAPA